jgi:Holliday junction DNA helicase RuvA
MFAFLEGTLVSGGTEAILAVGGGVGLDVQVSALAAERLPAPGERVKLWTHLAVREDQWSLFGFVDLQEREMFRLLITVSGIGPKVALGMLSAMPPSEMALYLRAGDEKALTRLPGVGKKSAARLVVELGQRVPQSVGELALDGSDPGSAPAGPMSEGLAVLTAMGLPPVAAEQALERARRADAEVTADVEKWIRAALRLI